MATKEQLGEFIRDLIRAEVSPLAQAIMELQEEISDLEARVEAEDSEEWLSTVLSDGAVTIGEEEDIEEEVAEVSLATVDPEVLLEDVPQDHTSEEVKALQARLDAVKALHRLEAIPIVHGKEEGAWEVRCVLCNPQNFVVWRKGDNDPKPCKTWMTADGAA